MQAFTGFYRFTVPRFHVVNRGGSGCWCGNGCGTGDA